MRVLCSPAAPPRAAAAAARRLPLRAPPRRAVPPRRAAFASLPPPADDRRRGPSPPRVAGAAEPSSAPSPGPAGGIIAVEKAINAALVNQVIRFVDTFWADKPYARFYALETVARVPYFGAGQARGKRGKAAPDRACRRSRC
jgi:ubiquinol oxidase